MKILSTIIAALFLSGVPVFADAPVLFLKENRLPKMRLQILSRPIAVLNDGGVLNRFVYAEQLKRRADAPPKSGTVCDFRPPRPSYPHSKK